MFVSGIRQTIVTLHQSGVSQRAIARQLGLGPTTVSYHLRRAAAGGGGPAPPAPVRDGRAASIPNTRAEVGRLLGLGVARVEIARRLGVSKATVSYHARRLGQPVDERCARRYDWSAVQRYYDAGHSVRECIEAVWLLVGELVRSDEAGSGPGAAEHDTAVRASGRRHVPRALQPQAAAAARGRQAGTVRAVRRDGVVRPGADAGVAPRQRATR
jgi:DNA-binding CsgD family transcriptional regulator